MCKHDTTQFYPSQVTSLRYENSPILRSISINVAFSSRTLTRCCTSCNKYRDTSPKCKYRNTNVRIGQISRCFIEKMVTWSSSRVIVDNRNVESFCKNEENVDRKWKKKEKKEEEEGLKHSPADYRANADDGPSVYWPPRPLLQGFPCPDIRRSFPSRRMVTVLCSSPEFWLFYRKAVAHDTRDTPAGKNHTLPKYN